MLKCSIPHCQKPAKKRVQTKKGKQLYVCADCLKRHRKAWWKFGYQKVKALKDE